MPHIAMVVPTWVGHLNPMTTLGRELKRRGHRVTVLSFPDSTTRIARAGLEHHPIGERTFPVGEWERLTRELSVMTGMRGIRFTIEWLGRISSIMLNELPELLRRGGYDGMVMDQICYGAETAAFRTGMPMVVACNALPVHLQPDVPVHSETWPWSDHPLAVLRNRIVQRILVSLAGPFLKPLRAAATADGRRWDILEHLNEIPPSLAHVAQLPACLDFPRRHAPDHFHHTGPWHVTPEASDSELDAAGVRLDGRPLVYASIGTLQNGLDALYQIILDACDGLPMQVVLALGRENGRPPARIPANAQVLGYAPQAALLERSSLVVTHAGMNTTLEALSRGLPMVALPITNEQPGIAARLKHVGAAEWLPIRNLKPARLRATILQVFNDPTYRARARACAAEIARESGLAKAAAIVEQAVITRQRVRRLTTTN